MADITQRIVWTLCPAGLSVDGGKLRFHLHVSPRLVLPAGTAPADLSHFPVWQDWPATLARASFTILGFHGGGRPATVRADADSGVWQAMFPVATPVIPHQFDDYRGTDVLVPPIAALADAIERQCAELAATDPGQALPPAAALKRLSLFAAPRERRPLKSLLSGLHGGLQPVESLEAMLSLFDAYHRPLAEPMPVTARKRTLADGSPDSADPHEDCEYEAVPRVAMPTAGELREQIDFHRIVSGIGQHPVLMPLTGLVVPLEVDRSNIADDVHLLSIEVDWDPGDVRRLDDVFCVTRCRLAGDSFQPLPKSGLVKDGWLRAQSAHFNLVQLDVDGAALTIMNFASQLPRIGEERIDDEERIDFEGPMARVPRAGAPRLRTGGILFTQTRRDVALGELFKTAGGYNDDAGKGEADGTPPILHAEDLIKGWRVDVSDAARPGWQSLMRFDGSYDLLNGGPPIPPTSDEEAMARLGAAAAADPKADGEFANVLKVSEALFGWSGWSLAAPPPGRAILPDEEESVGEAPEEVPAGLPLATAFKAHPGSLPVLRFGHSYRVRLRSADLAGWGVAWDPDARDAGGTTSRAILYGRYEPVETPVLTLVDDDPDPADGESMSRAALRTMDDPARDSLLARRIVAPARVGHRFAETHGVLDGPDGRPRADRFTLLSDRDQPFAETVVTTEAWTAPPEGGGARPTAQQVHTSYATSLIGSPTPYLPDPLCAGCAIRVTGVPGINPNKIHFIPFYDDAWDRSATPDWPNQANFALAASPGGTFGWDADTRTFAVPLEKGERARIHISALIPDAGIRLMKLRELVLAYQGKDAWNEIERMVRNGGHWMFNPSRMVELVHALQRPLITPKFLGIWASRTAASVSAWIGFRTPLHAKSTARLDVEGSWIEIDDVSGEHPFARRVSAHAFDYRPYRLATPANMDSVSGEHVFADTRARLVTYRAIATTRFREYMPPDIRDDAAQLIVESGPADAWVPSATAPPAPAVRYMIPTFGWTRNAARGSNQSWRRGGGLRVYLDRPWYASGPNEMLAVCLMRGDPDTIKDSKTYASQWGADPAWIGEPVTSQAPAPVDFPLRVAAGPIPYAIPPVDDPDPLDVDPAPIGQAESGIATGPFRPQGAPSGIQVDVAPHAVGYDRERQLWYCDIVIRPGDAYFPFVRLALARFQPHSVGGLELSAPVVSDFAQLAPDRLAIVTREGSDPRQRTVSVYGNAPAATDFLPRGGEIRIELQRLAAGGDPDLDWKKTEEGRPRPFIDIVRDDPLSVRRLRLDRDDRVRLVQAEKLVAQGRFAEVLRDAIMVDLLRPPLIHRESLILPSKGRGERLRLLITEIETYATGPSIAADMAPAELIPDEERQERIVYAETVEL